MSQRFTELTTYLVEEILGSLAATVYETLAARGRLTLPQVQQYHDISLEDLKYTVISMLQHHLLYHSSTEPEFVLNEDGQHDYRVKAYYQVNWRGAYNTLRVGRFVALVDQRFGKHAAEIVETLALQGHGRISTIAAQCKKQDLPGERNGKTVDQSDSRIGQNGNVDTESTAVLTTNPGIANRETNGLDVDKNGRVVEDAESFDHRSVQDNRHKNHHRPSVLDMTEGRFHQVTRELLKAGFLSQVGEFNYTAAADEDYNAQEAVMQESFPDRKVTGPKKKLEFRRAVNHLKRSWREANEYLDSQIFDVKGTTKRGGGAITAGPNKLQKVNGNSANTSIAKLANTGVEEHDSIPRLSPDMIVGMNSDKIAVALRTQHLERLATRYLGESCGAVYGALLRSLEGKIKNIGDGLDISEDIEDDNDRESKDQPSSTVIEIAGLLDAETDLMCSIAGLVDSQSTDSNNKRKHQVLEEEDDFTDIGIKKVKKEQESDEETSETLKDGQPPNGFHNYREKNRRLKNIEKHLSLLSEHSLRFCERIGVLGGGEYQVDFAALTQHLIQQEVDTVIHTRYGRVGMRVVRMLRETGKLEEKEIALYTMMRMKSVRAVLNDLTSAGFVDFQEIPKDNSRTPGKTIYLYYVDQKRLEQKVLHEAYLQTSRCLQRLSLERTNKFKDVLEKSERILNDYGQEAHNKMMNAHEKHLLAQWEDIEERIWVTIERCDEVIAVLRDFSGNDTSMMI